MNRSLAVIPVLFLLAGRTVAAQEPQCQSPNAQAQAACNTMVDATKAFHPLAGMIISGGNPALGTAATLGGFGHLSATLRVNAIKASLPNPDSAARNPVPSSFDGYLPAPVVEAAVGLYRGTGGGLLSLDALGSAMLLPASRVRGMTVDPDAPKIGDVALGIGYGARIGILRGSFPVPTVSVSVMKRHVPRVQFGDVNPPTSDPADFSTDFDATTWRVVAGTRIVFADVAAGLGVDHYTSAARIHFFDGLATRTVTLDLANTRQVLFLDAGLTAGLARLVVELGYQTGTDQSFSTTFADFDPKAGHVFWGAGLRVDF
ncbi:MAG TPA: hypothetical protein VGQ25_07395 [Gemmatimonadales bacterium]|jgi:hypothetical protein|nr:hypothetical protein [Gemmatimonadales bacterium]